MLVADSRGTKVLEEFTVLEEKFTEVNESLKTNVDSLQKQIENSTEVIPEIVTQFNVKADELLTHIQLLKQELIPNGTANYDYKDPEIEKNDAVFFTTDGKHSEKGAQFIAKIKAYENIVAVIHVEFPKTNTRQFKLRNDIPEDQDWLTYNHKGFPVITSYVKLVAMESVIKSKKEIIFATVLSN